MKTTNKLLAATAIATTAFIFSANNGNAAERAIEAHAKFRQAIALTDPVNIEYGTIEYTGAASANNIDISANGGIISCSNTADYTCPPTGTAGAVTISGSNGMPVQISCESSGVVSNGTDSLNLTNTQIRVNGANQSCAGLGTTAATHTLAPGTNTMNLGARLVVPSTGIASAGDYSTTQTGGDSLLVRVVYQ